MKASASTRLPPLSITAAALSPTTSPRLQIAPSLPGVINSFLPRKAKTPSAISLNAKS
jgi:hypothetical protein